MSRFWAPNAADVAHETFDGEVMLISFDSGCYYSLRGVSAVLWERLSRGATEETLVAFAERRFQGEGVAASVRAFLASLAEARLVLQVEGAPEADREDVRVSPQPFEEPVIEAFTDMQELLWLDPIHDVDEAGWPLTQGAKNRE